MTNLELAKKTLSGYPVFSQESGREKVEIGYVFRSGKFQSELFSELIHKAELCSCFGDVLNIGIDPSKTEIDTIGRVCQRRTSQKPSSMATFLDPITHIFIRYKTAI